MFVGQIPIVGMVGQLVNSLPSIYIIIAVIALFVIENCFMGKKSKPKLFRRILSFIFNNDKHVENLCKLIPQVAEESESESNNPTLFDELPKMSGLPYFGSFFSLGKHPHVTLAKIAKEKFNNKNFIVKAGQRKFVVFTDYDDIQYIAKNYPEQLFGKPRSFTTGQVTIGAHNDLVERWKKRRAYTNAGLKHMERSSINDIVTEEVEEMIGELDQFAVEGKSRRVPVDIRHEVTYQVSKVMHRMSYGNKLDEMSMGTLKDIVHKLADYTTSMGSFCIFDMLPFLRKFFRNKFSKFINFNKILTNFCKIEKEKCLANEGNANHPHNLLLFFKEKIEKIRRFDKERYSDLDSVIYEGLEDIIRAGTESTSLTLQWCLLYVAKFPHVQKKMQEEIDSLLARKQTDKLLLDFYDDLPYCQAVLAETLRFCSLNPFLKRELLGDIVTRDGVLIPTGTSLIFNNWALNFDESFWDQPLEFQPERFLDRNGQMDPEVFDHLMSFGFGRRRCIGIYTGRSICHFTAVSIVHRFNMKPESCTSDIDIEPVNGIGLSPKPFKVVLERRNNLRREGNL